MYLFKSKKRILILLVLAVLILIFSLLSILYVLDKKNNISFFNTGGSNNLTNKVNSQLLKFGKYFNSAQVNGSLEIINNTSISKKERFEALKSLSFHFATAYSASHDPEIRKNSEIVKSYAENNFPEFYKDESGAFAISCADPKCGDKPDKELLSIRTEMTNLKISKKYLDTIIYNFDQSMYIPVENIDEKLYGFNLAISGLESENNKEASVAAKKLKDYVISKYSKYIDDEK